MRVRMIVEISGTSPVGGRWPKRGGEIDLPDHTATKLIGLGQAEPVADPAPAPKPVKKAARKATKRPAGETRND